MSTSDVHSSFNEKPRSLNLDFSGIFRDPRIVPTLTSCTGFIFSERKTEMGFRSWC